MIDDDYKRGEKRIQVGEGWRLGGDGDDDVEMMREEQLEDFFDFNRDENWNKNNYDIISYSLNLSPKTHICNL